MIAIALTIAILIVTVTVTNIVWTRLTRRAES